MSDDAPQTRPETEPPTEVNAATPVGEAPAPVDAVPGLGEPAAPGHAPVPPQSDEVGQPVPAAPAAPPAPGAPTPVTPPSFDAPQPAVTSVSAPEPASTASGYPNPHGLPEIAVERPEVGVGAAFAGGVVLALLLKRLAR